MKTLMPVIRDFAPEESRQLLGRLQDDQRAFVDSLASGMLYEKVEEQIGVSMEVVTFYVLEKLKLSSLRELLTVYLRATETEGNYEERRQQACDAALELHRLTPMALCALCEVLNERSPHMPDDSFIAQGCLELQEAFGGQTPASIILRCLVFKLYGKELPIRDEEPELFENLTRREMEIMQLYCGECLPTREIAERLFISIKTVETHRQHLCNKLEGCQDSMMQVYVRLTDFPALTVQRARLDTHRLFEKLTPREVEILNSLAQGKPTKEIAGEIHVSIKTVETHRQHISDKAERCISKVIRDFLICTKYGLSR